ncbi:Phosphatidylinositol-4-phosphate 5-kinase [Ceratobasidium sp. 428]|nr:Phosphatidylinositol-4-phosphate 5-kinase [Ceratobasidium sp. 428]
MGNKFRRLFRPGLHDDQLRHSRPPTPVPLDPNNNDPLEPGGNTNALSIRSAGSGWSGGDYVVTPAISVRSEVPSITRVYEPDPLRPRLLDETQLERWRRQHPPSRAQRAKCNTRTPNPAAPPLATRTRSQILAGQDLRLDILKEAEQIRRKRNSKRSRNKGDSLDTGDKVLVGNLIGEGHANYVLMHDMLTGIRIGKSTLPFRSPVAKPKSSANTHEDFTTAHKFSFDIIGNEPTPSAKYDLNSKDCAP